MMVSSGFRFSVHTTPSICADLIFGKDRAELMVQFTLPKNPQITAGKTWGATNA